VLVAQVTIDVALELLGLTRIRFGM
jgi:hypothetical protein